MCCRSWPQMMDPRDPGHQPLLHQRSLLLDPQEKKRWGSPNTVTCLWWHRCYRCGEEFTSIFSSVEHHQSRIAQGNDSKLIILIDLIVPWLTKLAIYFHNIQIGYLNSSIIIYMVTAILIDKMDIFRGFLRRTISIKVFFTFRILYAIASNVRKDSSWK